MAIAAEFLSFDPAWSSIQICVTHIAISAGIVMPVSMIVGHKTRVMCFRISSFSSIGISVACNAHRISSFRTMTCCTRFDISSCKPRMFTAAAANAERCKSSHCVRCRLECTLIHIASSFVARCAKFFSAMARLTFRQFTFCSYTMSEAEIQIMYFY